MAKKTRKRKAWTPSLLEKFRKHSKAKTPVAKLVKLFKRTPGALRQKAVNMGIPLGHQRRRSR